MSRIRCYGARGIFAWRDVLTPEASRRLCCRMKRAGGDAARVNRGGTPVVDPAYRRTRVVSMDEHARRHALDVLEGMASELSRYAGEPLGPCQPPIFLAYSPGDYFRPHCDNADDPRQPLHVRSRRLTVVLFLNGPRPRGSGQCRGDEGFSGGELVLYCTMPEPSWEDFYTVVHARPGTLVAFPADTFHEVTPLTAGRRYSIVTWFEKAGAGGG
ncbi:2OG-Fe(II) oxygenase [Arhodomonas sp. AD133]|uniref:2OG-Fe(II) oxygenase n=1 Tax=Arhodomonas sp. AD133 TaxID=3415009 RepID=UPI003EB72E9D